MPCHHHYFSYAFSYGLSYKIIYSQHTKLIKKVVAEAKVAEATSQAYQK